MSRGAAVTLALAVLLGALASEAWRWWRLESVVQRRLAERVEATGATALACPGGPARPLVLLALGQSNAANHGPQGGPPGPAVTVFSEGRCLQARDPLPGGTGRGASIWSRLPGALAAEGYTGPVVIAVLALDASAIDDWTRRWGALPRQLDAHLAAMRAAGLAPDLILWQQGEADARAGTPPERYVQRLGELQDRIAAQGVRAPLLVARSTVCRSAPQAGLRQALDQAIRSDERLRAGPDTDALAGPGDRHDGCHFSLSGLEAAARLWSQAIVRERARVAQQP